RGRHRPVARHSRLWVSGPGLSGPARIRFEAGSTGEGEAHRCCSRHSAAACCCSSRSDWPRWRCVAPAAVEVDAGHLTLALTGAAAAGWIDAVVGGGGLIQLPTLLLAAPGLPLATVLGTNKVSSIAGTSMAAYTYLRRTKVDWRVLGAAVGLGPPPPRVRPAAGRARPGRRCPPGGAAGAAPVRAGGRAAAPRRASP